MPRPAARSAAFLVGGFLAVLLLACPTPAHAQAREALPDSLLTARFQLAESYLRAGQHDRAIVLLEDLNAARPGTHVFYEKLKEAYEGLKRYDDAIALVDARLAEDRSPVFLAEKARLLYQKGDEDAAFATWDAALALAPESQGPYRVVYTSMNAVRLLDRAVDVLERGRERIGDPAAFRSELAALYSYVGRHEDAFDEYLALLADNPAQLGYVRTRLHRFVEQPEAVRAGTAAVERAIREDPLNRAFREFAAWLYLESGDYRKAFDANRAIDRLEEEDGRVLYAFAQNAASAGAYDVAGEAFDEVLQRYPDAPSAADARLGVGLMHEQWADTTGERAYDAAGNRVPAPHYERALEAYRTFLQAHPNHPHYPEVLRRIGHLQQTVFFDLGAAEANYAAVVQDFPTTSAADRAALSLAELALLRDRPDEARRRLSGLVDRLRTGELAERARFELARLHFYAGEFDAALTLADVLNSNTSTDVANDAIQLKVLLVENRGPDSLSTPLRHFAEASLLLRQRRADESVRVLDALLSEHGRHGLADDARFLRATALDAAGRTEEALAARLEFPLLHPDSYLADRSLYEGARLQAESDPAAAIETLTRLLADYPGSLLAAPARARIRSLRGEAL